MQAIENNAIVLPDIVMPSQHADMHTRRNPLAPLMLAILEISLRDILGARLTRPRKVTAFSVQHREAHDRRDSRHKASAIHWMQCRDGSCGPFCYRNVCDILGIDPDKLRKEVLTQKSRLKFLRRAH